VTATRLRDSRGRNIPTVIAAPLDDAGKAAKVAAGRRDEDHVLAAIEKHPGASLIALAEALGWAMRDGKPYGVRVRRAAEKLAADGLVHKHRGALALTSKGEKELNAMDGRKTYTLTPGTNGRNNAVPLTPLLPAQQPS
jgi:hypothetical protein